jgi:peptidoglycan/LPS O-acetylase OafA/YrhL
MVIIAVGILGLVRTSYFGTADIPPIPTNSRVSSLDGLRGFLALAVFFHHSALYHTYLLNGRWGVDGGLYWVWGSFAVSMFFMVTGFLFWSQILAKKGRPDWLRLYIGRVFRIGPLYLVTIAIMVVFVFIGTGTHLRVSLATLVSELTRWSALGFWSGIPINGVDHTGVFLAFGVWTLRWEWFFYASLLVTSLFARHRVTAWAAPLIGLAGALVLLALPHRDHGEPQAWAFVGLFCVGMLTATAREAVSRIDFKTPLFSTLAVSMILAVLMFFHTAYDGLPICLLGGSFFLIANGTTIFGLLTSRAARRLGDISFGIYLLQGLVLGVVFATSAARRFALASPAGHWIVLALAGFLLVSFAAAGHALIERPGIDLGRRLGSRLSMLLSGYRRSARGRGAQASARSNFHED